MLALAASGSCVLTERELGANLTCESGSCQCVPGWADCDGDPATGCELSLTSDPVNCGACGHDCLGGECVEGQCQPVVIYESFSLSAINIALGSRHLFWREDRLVSGGEKEASGSVKAIALEGDLVETLASGVPQSVLAAGGDTLFWVELVEGQVVLRAASPGIPAHDVAVISSNPDFSPNCLVADEAHVYVGAVGDLLEVDPTTGAATPIAAWQSPCDVIARAGSYVVWMDPSMSALHAFDVGLREELSFPLEVRPTWTSVLAASPAGAYWAEGTDPWFVRTLSFETGDAADLASLTSGASAMVATGSHLYIGRAGAGVIESILLSSGARTEVATGQPSIGGLCASADALYFSSGRRIKRLAR